VLIGMAAGILLGYFGPALGERMAPLGDAFIKAIRMLIAPIIFAAEVGRSTYEFPMTSASRSSRISMPLRSPL
jgi:aerobic C4-dicarboxylate transport protein